MDNVCACEKRDLVKPRFWKRAWILFKNKCGDPTITRMRSNPRYKLGRISFFFFFFVMVVANCNESCYWLQVHCSQWQLLLFFPSEIKIAFVAIWRVSCSELGYCLTRCTNRELVAKCEHILCMTSYKLNERAAKPRFVAQS